MSMRKVTWCTIETWPSQRGSARNCAPPWKGPAQGIACLSPVVFRLRHRNAVFTVNHDRLNKCKTRGAAGQSVPVRLDKESCCLCRKPDDGKFMIQCDRCDEWFRGRCVHVWDCDGMEYLHNGKKYLCLNREIFKFGNRCAKI